MASANRPSRFSSRTSSPFTSQQNKTVAQQENPSIPRSNIGSNGWVEPPLRPPVPSFMDHKGLERQGVLEQMVALGTHPTAKVKARSKGDPVRRTVQARNLDDMVVDDTRATPDILIGSTTAPVRTPSAGERDSSRRGSALDAGEAQSGAPSYALFPPSGSAHSLSASSLQNTPPTRTSNTFVSPTSSMDPFEKALSQATFMAVQNERPDVEQGLMNIRAATLQDPQLATLLGFAVTNDSLSERGSAVNRKLKKLKQNMRSQNSSPQSQQGSLSGAPVSHPSVSRSPSQSRTHTIGQGNNRDGQAPPTSLKLSLKPRSASAVNGVPKENIMSSREMKQEPNPSNSRRSSSSSLSSVDEHLAAGPPPSSDLAQSDVERSSVQPTPLLDEDDTEIEARKENMKKHFPTVVAMESNERPGIPKHPSSAGEIGSFKPATKLKLKGPADSLRNGIGIEQGNHNSPTPDPSAGGSAALKRKATTPTNLGRPPKKPRTEAKIKMSPQKKKQPAVIAGIARPQNRRHTSVGLEDHHSEQSENNDYCFTCSGTGYLLCCDGCDRAFHFTCLDPPLDEKATLDGPWLCHACQAERGFEPSAKNGLFAQLQSQIATKNPTSFILPQYVREYFKDVQTGPHGEYVTVVNQKANPIKGRMGYDEQPNFQKLKDDKGNYILCCHCHKSSLGQRDIITCDRCSNHWHLDCLNPPLANPPPRGQIGSKTRREWVCPLHIEHDLDHLDPIERNGVRYEGTGRTHKVRRPNNAKIVVPALRRGFKNNGLIEITDDESSADEQEYDEDDAPDGVVYKLSSSSVKLDFIDRVKCKRQSDAQATYTKAAAVQLRNAVLDYRSSKTLSQDISRRHMREQIAALNLAQLATNAKQIDVGLTEIDNFLFTVLAETPADVIDMLDRAPKLAPTRSTDGPNAGTPSSLPATTAELSENKTVKPFDDKQRVLAKMLIGILQAGLGEDKDKDKDKDNMPNGVVNGS